MEETNRFAQSSSVALESEEFITLEQLQRKLHSLFSSLTSNSLSLQNTKPQTDLDFGQLNLALNLISKHINIVDKALRLDYMQYVLMPTQGELGLPDYLRSGVAMPDIQTNEENNQLTDEFVNKFFNGTQPTLEHLKVIIIFISHIYIYIYI